MYTSYILTNQKVPDNLKTKEWHVNHIRQFVTFDVKRVASEKRQQQLNCWKAYMCINDKESEKRNTVITNPYGFGLGMQWISYPLIESKLEQMIGEFITRGIKKKTYVLNKAAQTKKLDDMFDLVAETILRDVNKEMEPALGFAVDTPNPDKELPEDLETYLESDYKTISEQVSDTILNQVLVSKKQIDKIRDLLLDFLLFDECTATVETEDGHPSITKENIFSTELDFNPEKETQDDPNYVIKNKILSYNEIINSFDLTSEEEECLKQYQRIDRSNALDDFTGETGFDNGGRYSDWLSGDGNLMMIRCVEMTWKSQKKIRVKVSLNKVTGKEIYKSIPENYKARKTDNIKSIWVQQKRFCIMVGPDLVLDYGVDNERASRIDDPRKDTLYTVSIRRNHSMASNQLRSAAAKLLQLQEFASECLFELRLAMRRNNGRVLVYDAAQIPKQFLKTGGYQNAINRVMHHVKKDQFLIINSQDKQSRYAFNQFTSLDMSTKGLMTDLFNMLALIEDLAGKFIGISPQQEGQVSQYESATGTERAVAQTTVRQEVYIRPFESFLKFLFDKILIKGKYCYQEGEVTQYVFGDLKTKFFTVYPEYFQEDTGTYIGDNFAEQKRKNIIDAAAQQTMASAQTPDLILNLIEVLNADTAGESEAIFRKGIKAMNALKEQERQAEADNAKTVAEATDRATESATKIAEERNVNNIEVAKIYADNKSVTDSIKQDNENKRKLADIEKDLLLAEKKDNKSPK